MASIDDILNGPDYFYCERFRATLRRSVCVERQGAENQGSGGMKHLECQGCSQGREISDESRVTSHESGEGRSVMKTKVCAKCGLEKPVEEFNRHKLYKDGLDRQCKSCKAEYARHYWQRRKGKKEEEKAEPGKREVETGKRAAEGGSGNGIFDWGKVEELLTGQRVTRERVRAVAEDQVRTVEEEMAFLLVRGLKTDEMKLKARDGSIL